MAFYDYKGKRVEVVAMMSDVWIYKTSDGSKGNGSPKSFKLLGNNPAPTEAFVPAPDIVILKINDEGITADDISNAIHGVGRRRAEQILANRPEGGYLSWEHFKIECGLSLNWGNIEAAMRERNVILEY